MSCVPPVARRRSGLGRRRSRAPRGASRTATLGLLSLAAALGCAGLAPERPGSGRGGVRGELRVVHARPGAPLPPAVVYLTREGRAERGAAGGPLTVRRSEGRFLPPLAAASRGQALRIESHDELHHRVFALTPEGRLELPLPPGGEAASVELASAGLLRFYCSLHAEESFSVFVAPTPHFALVDEEGRYAIRGVPSGPWELHVWTEAVEGPVRTLELGARTLAIEPIVLDARLLLDR